MVQLVLAARVEPQSPLSAKLPLAETPVIVIGEPPVLVRVTVLGRLVVPTAWEPKERLDAERLAAGGVAPDPARVIV